MKKSIRFIGTIAAILIGTAVVFTSVQHIKAEEKDLDTIYDGIYLGAVNVSGLTEEEAKSEYNEYLEDLGNTTLRFELEEEEYSVDMADLSLSAVVDGAIKDAFAYGRTGNILKRYREITDISNENIILPVDMSVDEEVLIEQLNENFSDYIIPATNASLEMSGGELNIINGESGKEINVEDTIDALWTAIDSWNGDSELVIEVATDEIEPQHSADELLQVKDVLGSFETTYSASDASRNNNIANAASKISGIVVYPGEEFDTMSQLVPFTVDNGWSYAGAYLNGEVISDIGGGICQVSTTLYNAVLDAELEVTERYPHSMAVGYVQLSADAALNEGTKNFCFKNNTDAPIFVYSYAKNGVMHVTIYGQEYRDSNRTVEYKNEILGVISPGDPIETVDESLPSDYRKVTQSAHTGYSAKLWKYVYVDGELVDTILVNTSYYSASPERVTVGKKEEATEAPVTEAPVPPSTEATEAPASEVTNTEVPTEGAVSQ